MRLPINAQCWNKKTRSMLKNLKNVRTFLPHIAMINENTSARLSLAVLISFLVSFRHSCLFSQVDSIIFSSCSNCCLPIWQLPQSPLKPEKLPYRFLPLVTFKIQTVHIAFKGGVSEKIFLKKCSKSLFLAEQLCEMGGSRHIKTVQNYPRAQRHSACR